MIARLRPLIILTGLIGLWQAIVWLGDLPPYILPDPLRVLRAGLERRDILLTHAATTLGEIILGLILGALAGGACALGMAFSPALRRWLLPVLVVSQAVPVFALAPILVLWLGYGIGSKIAMATLIIFFPVTGAFFDGLRRTDPGWLELGRTMGANRWRLLWRVRLPAALPAFASGVKVAAAVAPIGAVVGEWVGASRGLGYLMLHANGRAQIDLMFAVTVLLAVMAVGLYFAVDIAVRRLLPWQPDALTQETRSSNP